MSKSESFRSKLAILDLIKVVSRLRDPIHGCPWDIKQNHQSLIPFVLEETYEVVDSIRENNDENLCEELGDLLLQVVLHAEIANQRKKFSFNDVARGITEKLIRRHPHIFNQINSSKEKYNEMSWEEIKVLEKPYKDSKTPITDQIKEKVRAYPASNGAVYISKQVTKVGFDWANVEAIWNKLNEELEELKEAIQEKNNRNAEEELGDVMFTLINIARWYNLSTEEGLAKTNKKFMKRFSYMESILKDQISNKPREELKELWKRAKKAVDY